MQFLSDCRDDNPINTCSLENLEVLDRALSSVAISREMRIHIYKVLSAILHLGNVVFEENRLSGKCQISQPSKFHFECTANLLNMSYTTLQTALLTRTIEINGSDQIMYEGLRRSFILQNS